MKFRISVVTICYNDLDGLMRTIDSLTPLQPYIEHIVVDGASNDGTVDYLKSLPRERIWISEPDKGRYDAMNKGAGLATGDLLWFMHAGDRFASGDVIDRVIENFAEERWNWAYGLARLRSKDGSTSGVLGNIPFRYERFAVGGRPIPHQAAVISREFFSEVGEFDLKHGLAADQLWFLEAAKKCAPYVISDFLCDFDNSGAGSMRPLWHHYWDMAKARRKARMADSVRLAFLDIASAGMMASAYAKRRLAF